MIGLSLTNSWLADICTVEQVVADRSRYCPDRVDVIAVGNQRQHVEGGLTSPGAAAAPRSPMVMPMMLPPSSKAMVDRLDVLLRIARDVVEQQINSGHRSGIAGAGLCAVPRIAKGTPPTNATGHTVEFERHQRHHLDFGIPRGGT